MTYDALVKELSSAPELANGPAPRKPRAVVGGMGGSALPAYAARFLDPTLPLATHRDYDLPENADADTLYIAISYSGNTAETLSFARAAHEREFPLVVIDSAGELLSFAKDNGVPHIEVPTHVQPRNALFFLTRALLSVLGRSDLLEALAGVSFDAAPAENEAHELAEEFAGARPLFYAARQNGFLAYAGKINCNETAKTPAFANVFPELNHNEMQAFDTFAPEATVALTQFVLLRDEADDARVARRMDVFTKLMRERDRRVTEVAVSGDSRAEKLVRTWYVLHRLALALAENRGVDPEAVPLIEAFKKEL